MSNCVDRLCPLCLFPVDRGHTVKCPDCHTLHHVNCWELNDNQCAVFTCKGNVPFLVTVADETRPLHP